MSLILVTGCSKSGLESSFVYSDRTLSLVSEAQTGFKESPGVKKLVDERFGDPQNLRAWQKLPIDFGGFTGTVESFPEGGAAIKEVTLAFESEDLIPEELSLVQFVNGSCSGQVASVLRWDAASRTATLSNALPETPAPGDIVSIGAGDNLKMGRGLYQRHCSHCHGTSGDGNGPTAQYLYPRPRDYRHGVFKFTTTNDQAKVSRDDLTRVLRQGIPGTYMPSFLLLADNEIHSLVEYVRFLAIRGEFERKVVNELSSDYSLTAMTNRVKGGESRSDIISELKTFMADDLPGYVNDIGDELAESWSTANDEEALVAPSIPRIPDSPESRRRGRELYLSKTLNCADCHGIYGRGDGPQTTIYEKNPVTNELYPEPGLHDVWDNVNQPRVLTQGIFRGGRRPYDLFCRLHAGIKGTRMPSFKSVPHEDIWHVVNYVLSIPFEVEPGASGQASTDAAAE
ncbi:MAG: cytochrome c [Planctomycetaceae bacterium]|nr:cytochrome c [Planctomycetaceae bacterium]